MAPPLKTAGRKRGSKKQIAERRMGVWEMVVCGESVDKIAAHFKVCEKTIQRDLDWWEEKLGYHTEQLKKDPRKAAVDVGTTAAKLEKIASDAYVEHAAAQNGAVKARMLQTSMHALVYRHKVLADAGYLPKVGHEQPSAPVVNISFEARFGKDAPEAVFDDPKSRRKVLEAAYKILNTGVKSDEGTTGTIMAPALLDGSSVAVPAEPAE